MPTKLAGRFFSDHFTNSHPAVLRSQRAFSRLRGMMLCAVGMAVLLPIAILAAGEPKEILLWPNGAPGSEDKTGAEIIRIAPGGDHVVSNVHKPSITPYLPKPRKATGVAVIVAPGGGHSELWIDHEGYNVARR